MQFLHAESESTSANESESSNKGKARINKWEVSKQSMSSSSLTVNQPANDSGRRGAPLHIQYLASISTRISITGIITIVARIHNRHVVIQM